MVLTGSGRGLGWEGGREHLKQRLCRQRQRQGAYVDCRPKARGFTRTGRRSVRQRGTCGRCPLVRWCFSRCIARCALHCLLRSALHERSACVVGAVEELAWRE